MTGRKGRATDLIEQYNCKSRYKEYHRRGPFRGVGGEMEFREKNSIGEITDAPTYEEREDRDVATGGGTLLSV